MIDTLKNGISFKANEKELYGGFNMAHIQQATNNKQALNIQPDTLSLQNNKNIEAENVIEKDSPKEKGEKKHIILNTLKGLTKFSHTAKGTLKGIRDGVITAAVVAFVGRNAQKGNGQIIDTFKSMGGNLIEMGTTFVTEGIPKIWKNSPEEWFKSLTNVPTSFYKYCASGVKQGEKGSKTVGAIATLAGIGVLGFNIIKGRLKGNKGMADLDHYTNNGHNKT